MRRPSRPTRYDIAYTRYQHGRSWPRRLVRRLYLANARAKLEGPTIDFGCGIGDLLRRLPPGSIGLEINQESVHLCRRAGLPVEHYDSEADAYRLTPLRRTGRGFRSMVISHVLEHLDDPIARLHALLEAGEALGVERVVVIVPGKAGFRSDPTHKTFVDLALLQSNRATTGTGFRLQSSEYFPLDAKWLGDYFVHHELLVVFTRAVGAPDAVR